MTEFEAQFLVNTGSEYNGKVELWVASCSAPEYLLKADDAFNYEEMENSEILELETKPKLVKELI